MAKFKGVIKICEECGAEFKIPPSRASTARYCSNECAYKHRMDGRRKRVTLICPECGQPFESVECQAHRRTFCSYACRDRSAEFRSSQSRKLAGKANPMWSGGQAMHSGGYVYRSALHHPFQSNGYVFEHRLVMESWLRENDPGSPFLIRLGDQLYLSPDYIVHHKDEDKRHNVIENLVCMTPSDHAKHHSNRRLKQAKK